MEIITQFAPYGFSITFYCQESNLNVFYLRIGRQKIITPQQLL